MANRRDDYMNKRSWLIDTAETPADKKRLKAELAKLDKKFNPNKVASKPKPKSKSADGSDTKPYNVRLIKSAEIIRDKPATKKVSSQNSVNDKAKTAMRSKIIKMNAKKTDSSAAARRLIAKKKAGKK
jgi:hypothetical protein